MPLLNELLHETNPIIGPGDRGQPLSIPRCKPLTCFTVNSMISPQTNLWSFTKVSMNSPSPVPSLLKPLPVSYQSAGHCKESTKKQLANKTLNRCINRLVPFCVHSMRVQMSAYVPCTRFFIFRRYCSAFFGERVNYYW